MTTGSVPSARRGTPEQRRWLRAYLVATTLSLVFVALLLIGDGEPFPINSYIGVGLGAMAAVTGTVLARQLLRAGVTDVVFAKATSSMRVISVGWLLLVTAIVVSSVASTEFGLVAADPAEIDEFGTGIQDLAGLVFGVAALIGVLGPGYTAYREAMAGASAGDESDMDESRA